MPAVPTPLPKISCLCRLRRCTSALESPAPTCKRKDKANKQRRHRFTECSVVGRLPQPPARHKTRVTNAFSCRCMDLWHQRPEKIDLSNVAPRLEQSIYTQDSPKGRQRLPKRPSRPDGHQPTPWNPNRQLCSQSSALHNPSPRTTPQGGAWRSRCFTYEGLSGYWYLPMGSQCAEFMRSNFLKFAHAEASRHLRCCVHVVPRRRLFTRHSMGMVVGGPEHLNWGDPPNRRPSCRGRRCPHRSGNCSRAQP